MQQKNTENTQRRHFELNRRYRLAQAFSLTVFCSHKLKIGKKKFLITFNRDKSKTNLYDAISTRSM